MATDSPTTEHGANRPRVVERSTRDLVRAAVSGWLGTALEFMDFQLYSLAAALVFSQLFFPDVSPAIAVVAAMATYGVGYVARPIGAWFFGRMGDRVGRTKVLVYSIALMGLSTTLIGFLPSYQTIGLLAPILLAVLRLGQGFGAGAEIAGAGVMLAEYAPARRRGIIASLVALGTNSGTLLASAIWFVLIAVLSEEQLLAWGWRIPFLGSFVVLLVALWIRSRLKESPVFEAAHSDAVVAETISAGTTSSDEVTTVKDLDTPASRYAAKHAGDAARPKAQWKAIAIAFFLRFGQAGNSGMIQTYLISFLTITLMMDRSVGTSVVMISSALAFITVPIIGALGDRFGRRTMYIIMSSISLVLVIPTVMFMISGSMPKVFAGYIILHNVSVMALASLENLTLPELFGSRSRYTRVAVTREISSIIATGIGPIVAAALVAATAGSFWPVIVMIGLFTTSALIAAIFMPEVAGRDLTDPEDAI